mgnify:CR=1 FL=1
MIKDRVGSIGDIFDIDPSMRHTRPAFIGRRQSVIDIFIKRGKHFIDIINNIDNKCVFFYCINMETFIIKDKFEKIINDLYLFENNIMPLNSKCKYEFICYIPFGGIDEYNNYDISKLDLFGKNFKNIKFCKYYYNRGINKTYGNTDDFLKLLENLTI